jgi:5-methylcytosine-specific restriction endonuclease McrA
MIRADVTLAGLRERAKKHRGAACEACGTTAGLHAHHRDENPANNDPANIATLCGSCHLKWHWREGKRAATRAA